MQTKNKEARPLYYVPDHHVVFSDEIIQKYSTPPWKQFYKQSGLDPDLSSLLDEKNKEREKEQQNLISKGVSLLSSMDEGIKKGKRLKLFIKMVTIISMLLTIAYQTFELVASFSC